MHHEDIGDIMQEQVLLDHESKMRFVLARFQNMPLSCC